MSTQADYGFAPFLAARYATAYAYQAWLNTQYDFNGVGPEAAFNEVARALDGVGLSSQDIWPNAVYVAPVDTVQAKVKAAFLLARVSRYLKSDGLARLAEQVLKTAGKEGNSRDADAIKQVYANTGAAIKGVAGARVTEATLVRALYVLGIQPGGAKGGPSVRDLRQDGRDAQRGEITPHRAGVSAVQEVLAVPGNVYRETKDALADKRHKKNKNKLRQQQLMYAVGAVLGVSVLLFGVSQLTKA